MFVSRRWWYAITIPTGIAALAICFWGAVTEYPSDASVFNPLIFFILPASICVTALLSEGHRPRMLLALVALLDAEATLLGSGPLIALPFVVTIPLVGLAVSARLTSPRRLPIPYAVAWFSSSAGVVLAVSKLLQVQFDASFVVIPLFAAADGGAILMLYRLDVTRQGAGLAISRAESQARDLLNGVDLLGVHVNRDSRIDFVNDFALALTGWTREELLGQNWYDTFATPERRESARQSYDHVLSGERVMDRQRESKILTRDGRVRLIRWNHVHRYGPDGSLQGVASLGEDVTDVVAAAEQRRRYEELVANLIRNSPLAAAVLGLDREVQLWNPAARDLFGWTEEELVGRPVPSVFMGRDRWVIARAFVEAARGEMPEPRLVQLITRDRRELLARFYVGAMRDQEGKPIAVSVQVEDVTAIHAMEERLREAQHMEAIGRLAGGVAHDFNNSLTAIGGFASLIAATTEEEETRTAASTILQASRRAADLTRELLAYSRRSLLKPQVIDVNELLLSVRPVLVRLVEPRAALVVDAHAPRAFVRVDPGAFGRAIENLVTNARDAMPPGGVVTVAIRDADEQVRISVTDTGSGIPPELQSKVFEPFFTTKPIGSGTGLGLAMVKGFVLQSGGQVELESDPDRGTTITIVLPAAGESEADGVAPASEAPRGGDETILLVEDEPDVAALGFRVLTMGGYRVLLADSGAAALGLLRGHTAQVDLFLLDVMLPDTRGPQLAVDAKTVHPEAAVLFASGYSAEEMARSGELPEGLDMIEKPYEPEELLSYVRRVLDRRSPEATAEGV